MAQVSQFQRSRGKAAAPVLKETRYDLVSAFMIALLIGFLLLTAWVFALWLANRPPSVDTETEIEILQIGGYEDGRLNETLKVESPEDPTDDPSVVDTEDESQLEETIENVVELSDRAAQQVEKQAATAEQNSGKIGSRDGTGGRPLGAGGGEGNFIQRWFIQFGDRSTLDSYAEQLDQYGIHLGLYKDNRIVELSNLSGTARRTIHTTGKDLKNQHYFTWAGGGRKQADIKLFKRHGVTVGNGIIFHFYPNTRQYPTISRLAKLERERAKKAKRKVKDIERTYFRVRSGSGGKWEFYVSRMTFK